MERTDARHLRDDGAAGLRPTDDDELGSSSPT